MSALSDFVFQVKYHWDILEHAQAKDGTAWMIAGTSQRGWIRQDLNRKNYEWEVQDAESRGDHWEQVGAIKPEGRDGTRVLRIAIRCRRAFDHRPALREARANGTYEIIAPLIIKLAKMHRRFIESHLGHQPDNWHAIRRHHQRALEEIEQHLVDDKPREPEGIDSDTTSDNGKKSQKKERPIGKHSRNVHNEIQKAKKKHEFVSQEQSIADYCERFNKENPNAPKRRQPKPNTIRRDLSVLNKRENQTNSGQMSDN